MHCFLTLSLSLTLTLTLTLSPNPEPKPKPEPNPQARLVPSHIYDEPQSYFIYGGLAFVALTEPYLHEWGDEWMSDAPHELVNLVMAGIAALPDEQPVSRPYSEC